MIKRDSECGLHFDLRLFDSAGNPVLIRSGPIDVVKHSSDLASVTLTILVPITTSEKDENK